MVHHQLTGDNLFQGFLPNIKVAFDFEANFMLWSFFPQN